MDTPERTEQARRLLEFSDRVSEPEDAAVICGDFNVEPESETLAILADQGFEDLVLAGRFEGTRTSHYNKPNRFADYMLVNQWVDVMKFDVVREPEVSDHCPLLLTL